MLESAVEMLELDQEIDWEDQLLTFGLERCQGCDCWMESGELAHDKEEDTGFCDQCI